MKSDYIFLLVVGVVGMGAGLWLLAVANERQRLRRLVMLSRKLAANHLAFNEAMDGSREFDFSQGERGPVILPTGKTRVTLWLDDDIVSTLTEQAGAAGKGIQAMVNEILATALKEQ